MSSIRNSYLTATLFSLTVVCGTATANDVYVAHAALGAGNGTSCANALPLSYFNSSSNWTSLPASGVQLGPGSTVHLCGTFASPAKIQGSGSSGLPVTILFEPGAKFIAATWNGSYALGSDLNSVSYIVIDGGANGSISTTANGTGLANSNDDKAIAFNPVCNNCEIRNLNIGPIYLHTVNTSDNNGTGSVGIAIAGSNVLVHNNTIHDAKWLLGYSYPAGASNVQLYSNTLYNCDHGVVVASRSTGSTVSSVVIHDNIIHDFNMWDNSQDLNHHDGIHAWADGAAGTGLQINSIRIYNNYVYGNFGAYATAGIYVEEEGGGGAKISNTAVFNNVVNNNSSGAPCCGLIYIKGLDANGQPSPRVYNNTLLEGTKGSLGVQFQGSGVTGAFFKNNIVVGPALVVEVDNSASLATSGSDRNVYFGTQGNYIYNGGWIDYSQWKTNAGGIDGHSVTTDPKLSSSFTLQSGSSAILLGANLTSVGIAPLDLDKAGTPRPSAGAWDAGAYASTGGGIAPPTSLSVIVQ